MKLGICAALVAAALACPDDWVNPCIIADTSLELGPKNEKWCGTSGTGYIGQVGGDGQSNHNYVNDFGKALGLYDTSLNIQSYNGVSASHGGRSSWEYNGNKYNTLYTSASQVYLQECSNICVNHPLCTSFAFEGTENAVGDEAQWDDHARGDVGQTGSSKTSTILRGRCYLYSYCDANSMSEQDNRKQWWIGTKEEGAESGTHDACTQKSALESHCKNDNSCIKECPEGQELLKNDDGKNYCEPCPAGTFKSGTNDNLCQPCSICAKGTFEDRDGECTRARDTQCVAHSPTCGNDAYEVLSAISGNDGRDRTCANCRVCAAGYEVEEGCRRADPWSDQYWKSTVGGKASNAISVTQLGDITGKVVVVHGPAGAKVGCGKLTYSTADDQHEASISTMPGYQGPVQVTGTFRMKQVQTVVKGSYTLAGLPASARGMFHLHEGDSCASPGGHYLNAEAADHSHRRRLGHSVNVASAACQKNGNWPFYCDEDEAKAASSSGGAHKMLGFWMPNSAQGMVMDGSYSGSAPQCTDKCGSGNTVCSPCVPGETFTITANSAKCIPVTPCEVGEYVTNLGTVTTDQQCGACTNKPANAEYTTVGGVGVSDCAWKCAAGHLLNNAGTECLTEGAKIVFQTDDGRAGKLSSFANGVLSFQDFRCVDEPSFCGVGSTLKQMEAKLEALAARVAALESN